MFPLFMPTEMFQYWNQLGTAMLRAQGDSLASAPVRVAALAVPSPATAVDHVIQYTQDTGRQAFSAAHLAQEHMERVTEGLFSIDPGREVFGPMMNGLQVALRSMLYCAQTCAEHRPESRAW